MTFSGDWSHLGLYLKKIKLLVFAITGMASMIALFISFSLISGARKLNHQREEAFLQIAKNVLQDFYEVTTKELNLVHFLVHTYNHNKDRIKQIEALLQKGKFTFVDNAGRVFTSFDEFDSSSPHKRQVDSFILSDIASEYNLIYYHTEIKNHHSQNLGYAFYTVSLAPLIEKMSQSFAFSDNAPSFFVLDKNYNEIYSSDQKSKVNNQKFCTKASSPFVHDIFLCGMHEKKVYKTLLLFNGFFVPLVFVVTFALYWAINSIERGMMNALRCSNFSSEKLKKLSSGELSQSQAFTLLSKIMHEVRTPLSIIISFSEMLKEQGPKTLSEKEFLSYSQEINKNAKALMLKVDKLIENK